MRNTKTLLAMIVVLAMIVSAAATSFVVSGNEETDEVSTESVESVESSEASAESADSVESSEDAADAVYGDVNADGDINSLDAAQVLRADAQLLTLEAAAILAADVNGDGDVNSLDAAQILKYDAQLITSFPVEEAGEESSEVSADSAESAESAESSDASVESVESSEAPVESSEAPIESADTPVESSEAPVESSEAPIASEEPSEAPIESSEAPVDSSEDEPAVDNGVNILLNKDYTVAFDGSTVADDGVKATDGKYRGDGESAWNNNLKGDASVEWLGTGKTITYTFTFDEATNVGTIVFKSVRIASNRTFGTLIINDTTVFMSSEVTQTPVAGAPLYSDAQVDQYFDVSVSVELNGITELKIQLITDTYCCQYDEVEAYAA